MIDKSNSKQDMDILIVSNEGKETVLNQCFIELLTKEVLNQKAYNLILLSTEESRLNKSKDMFSTVIHFDDNSKALLSDFNGVVMFESKPAKSMLENHIKGHNITGFNPIYNNYVHKYKMLPFYDSLETGLKDIGGEKKEYNANKKYKEKLNELYQKNNCANVLISVIIPIYNTSPELLFRAIRSVLDSTHKNVELIIVDDGSTTKMEIEINEIFHDYTNMINYYYKENEGPGLTRNYGVDKASGKFVFYLDSDDIVEANGLKLMLSHAIHFSLDMVVGKRVICDERSRVINESLVYLYGDTYNCYDSISSEQVYGDQMVTNKLIKRNVLIEQKIRFCRGAYEDVLYSTKLFSQIREYHFINIHIYNWYKYGLDTTISSAKTIDNLYERCEQLGFAWEILPEHARKNRLAFTLQNDYTLFLSNFNRYKESEKKKIWGELKKILDNRITYLDYRLILEKKKKYIEALSEGKYEEFVYEIEKLFCIDEIDFNTKHNDFIVLTHYHICVSILMALKSEKPSRLYVASGYVEYTDVFIERIRQLNVFDDVILFDNSISVTKIYSELNLRPCDSATIIPTYLYNPYKEIFRDSNPQIDVVYIFFDTSPYWYYIEREFNEIIKLEDPCNSFGREATVHELYGKWAIIRKYVGKEYPLINFESKKIKEISVSNIKEDVPKEFFEKIRVSDTKEEINYLKPKYERMINALYNTNIDVLRPDSVLLLTQPLALFGYCTKNEQKLLYRKICMGISKKKLFIKPHPSDTIEYDFLKGTILEKDVPIEVYNYFDIKIDKAIAFGFTEIETIKFAKEKKSLFLLKGFKREDVTKTIRKEIKCLRMLQCLKRKINNKV